MDRSPRVRGAGAKPARPQLPNPRSQPPSASRLTVKAKPNRRRPGGFWSRAPKPAEIADACGRALRRSLPAMIGVAVLGAVGGTAWGGYRFVTTSSRFAITKIEIHGTHQLSVDDVRASLPMSVGDNVFATDLDLVVRELRTNPWIASAEAHRELPHTIVIQVREHVPAAVAQLGGLYLVDTEGHPFKRVAADDGAGLPIITGLDRETFVASPETIAAQIRSALAALSLWREGSERPSIGEVHLDAHGDLTLITYEQAISIQLGTMEQDLALRMHTFDATWAELGDGERTRARAIHLDARSDQVTVALQPREKDL